MYFYVNNRPIIFTTIGGSNLLGGDNTVATITKRLRPFKAAKIQKTASVCSYKCTISHLNK